MTEDNITEALATHVANLFQTHNPTFDVLTVESDDGEWHVEYMEPMWVEDDPLGPPNGKQYRRERVTVATLLDESTRSDEIRDAASTESGTAAD